MMYCSLSLPGPNADCADSLRGSHAGVFATSRTRGPASEHSRLSPRAMVVIPSGSEGSFVPFSWPVGHETAGWIPRRFAPRDVTLPSAYATVRSEEHVRVGPRNPR